MCKNNSKEIVFKTPLQLIKKTIICFIHNDGPEDYFCHNPAQNV